MQLNIYRMWNLFVKTRKFSLRFRQFFQRALGDLHFSTLTMNNERKSARQFPRSQPAQQAFPIELLRESQCGSKKKGSFVPLPLPRQSCFFCSCPSRSRRTLQGNACQAGYHDHYRWASRNHDKTKLKRFRITAITATGWGQEEGPRGVLGISSDEDDRMGPKVKTQKNPQGCQQNPKKSHAGHMGQCRLLYNTCDVK